MDLRMNAEIDDRMEIIAILPARYASTRFPGKPLADIAGKSMIRRVYEQVQRSALVSRVMVATDDERIVEAVKAFGGIVHMTPVDIHSGSDRIALVAQSANADIVVNVQGDEPLIDPQLIDQTIQALLDNPSAVVSTAVKRITDYNEIVNPNIVKAVLDKNGMALYFSRAPIPHVRDAKNEHGWVGGTALYKHFGIYCYRAAFLRQFSQLPPTPLEQAEKLEQLRILEHGYKIACVVTEYESFAVDTPDDLQKVTERIGKK